MKIFVKSLLFIACLFAFSFSSGTLFAQKLKPEDVPDDVKQTLEFEHPSAKVSAWTLENNQFVATFKEDGSTATAYIANDGTWLRTSYAIPRKELPPALTDFVKVNYPAYIISISVLRMTPEERMHYYIEVKPEGVSGKISTLTFDAAGNLMSRQDPDDFVDPVKKPENTAPAPVAKTEKQPTKKTDSQDDDVADNSTSSSGSKSSSSKPEPKEKEEKPAPAPKQDAPKTLKAPRSSGATLEDSYDSKVEVADVSESKKGSKSAPVEDEHGNKSILSASVPVAVNKGLIKKAPIPENLIWFMIDTNYVAKCTYRGQNTEITLTRSGVWVKSLVEVGELGISGNISKHLDSFYKGYRLKKVVKETRADKDDKTFVEIYEKQNWKDKLATIVIFDKTGKLIRSIDPDYAMEGDKKEAKSDASLEKYYEKVSMSVEESIQNQDNIPAIVMNAFKAKYPRITNPQWSENSNGDFEATYMGVRGKEICVIGQSGTILQTQTQGNLDALSSAIQSYIKQNYKGFKVDEYFAVRELLDKKNTYKVLISNKKTGQSDVLWFTTAGKIIE